MQTLNATTVVNDDTLGYAFQFTGSDGTPLGVISAQSTVPGFGLNFGPGGVTSLSGTAVQIVLPPTGGQFTIYTGPGNAAFYITDAAIALPLAKDRKTDPMVHGAIWDDGSPHPAWSAA